MKVYVKEGENASPQNPLEIVISNEEKSILFRGDPAGLNFRQFIKEYNVTWADPHPEVWRDLFDRPWPIVIQVILEFRWLTAKWGGVVPPQ